MAARKSQSFNFPLKARLAFGGKPLIFALLTILILVVAYVTYIRALPNGNISGKPNIIVILSDDQRFDSMDAMPETVRQLGGQGVTFTNAFVTTPLCCPSRASFLTGQYAHNTGVWRNNPPEGGVESFDDTSTIAVWLKDAGYTTGLIGKYMNGYRKSTYVPPGWSEWHAFTKGNYYGYMMNDNGVLTDYGYEPEDYSGTVVTEKAVEFIRDRRRDGNPFFLFVTPNNPHGDSGKNIDDEEGDDIKRSRPAPKDEDTCQAITPYRPPNFNEEDISDKPSDQRNKKLLSDEEIHALDEFHKSQKCSLKSVDEMVGKIIRELGQMRENTMVIFYSDNGYAYGEHRNKAKNCLYEECIRVPMIISYPKITRNGAVSQAYVTNVDVTATIADVAGVTIPDLHNGKSILSILQNPTQEIQSDILLEVHNNNTNRKDQAVRTKQYKYIERGNGERELYDIVQDPYELINRITDPGYQTVILELAEKLASLKNS